MLQYSALSRAVDVDPNGIVYPKTDRTVALNTTHKVPFQTVECSRKVIYFYG